MGRVQGLIQLEGVQFTVSRLLPAACRRRQAITLDKCCDWLQHCLMNIPE